MKIIKCRNCGKAIEADHGISLGVLKLSAAGFAIGAVVGSIFPGIGTVLGGVMGAKCVAMR